MHIKFTFTLTFTLALMFGSASAFAAQSCYLSEALQDKDLRENTLFWQELAEVQKEYNGFIPDIALLDLVKKHKGGMGSEPVASSGPHFQPLRSIVYSGRRVESEIKALPAGAPRAKMETFLEIAVRQEGLKAFRENPGSWHLEKVPQYGHKAYTVRLNSGYRVLFDLDEDQIVVRRVNKGQIHGN